MTGSWRSLDFVSPDTPITLDNCAQEPLHFAGAIQPVGVMLVADAADVVVAATRNADDELGRGRVLGQRVGDLIGVESASVDPDAPPVIELASGSAEVVAHRNVDGRWIVELCLLPEGAGQHHPVPMIVETFDAVQDEATVVDLMQRVVERVRSIFEFDRVWAYRFAEDGHG